MEDEVYLVVKSVDLLTKEEAQKLSKNILNIDKWWWLQDVIGRLNAVCVFYDGSIGDYRGYFNDSTISVRPALKIQNLDCLKLPLYSELEIFNLPWIYIGNNKVLAKKQLWAGKFNNLMYYNNSVFSSKYQDSDIKRQLDAWLEEQKAKFNED